MELYKEGSPEVVDEFIDACDGNDLKVRENNVEVVYKGDALFKDDVGERLTIVSLRSCYVIFLFEVVTLVTMTIHLGRYDDNFLAWTISSLVLDIVYAYVAFVAAISRMFSLASESSSEVEKKQYERVILYIHHGKREGASLIFGGKPCGENGYYIEPAIFVNVTDDMLIAKDEIFGPIMAVMKFKIQFVAHGRKSTGKGVTTDKTRSANVEDGVLYLLENTFFFLQKPPTLGIENLIYHKVKTIRCDNGTEFKNKDMNQLCEMKGIRKEFSVARTPQQNGVAERKNRTLIEAARTMLADLKLPTTFWAEAVILLAMSKIGKGSKESLAMLGLLSRMAEAVNTACYVQNRVLVNKSQNKTPYELFNGRTPAIGFLKPFGCHVMILNTLDNLGKFEAKGDEGYFIGYSMSSKAFRVFNKRTKRIEENLHIDFLENKAIKKGAGPNWLFDIDSLTKSMNYVPVVVAESSSSKPQDNCSTDAPKSSGNSNLTATSTNPPADQLETLTVETLIPTVSSPVPTACFTDSQGPSSDTRLISKRVANQVETPSLDNILTLKNRFEDILGVTTNSDELNGVKADVSNIEITITTSPTPTLRIHKDHPKSQIIGLVDTPIQTKNKSKEVGEQSFIAIIHQKTDPALLQFCLFLCFLSQVEPKKIFDALQDPSWVEAIQEELLQFKIHNVWTLVDCPKGVRPIKTNWVLKNKKDERGIVIRNKARLVAQGHTEEEGIDYDKVFTPVAQIEAIRLFLAYALFMGFTVYQMDVKSSFLYGTIDEEVGTIDQTLFIRRERGDFILVQVYVDDIIFGSSNPQLCRKFEALMHEKFQMSAMGELNFFFILQVLQKEDGISLSQDKYVGDILKKFRYSDVRSSNTPMDKENPWGKDETRKDVDLHLYRSMIGSLMYLTASRLDIMFAFCACAMHQVTPKEYHFIIVATSTTEAEYVAAASCCGQVLWIQNQLLDYGTSKYCGVLRILMISLRLIPLGEHNVDFHPIVDFVEASPFRYALTFKPTVYVSHIRQFWSTARIETTEEGTKILATVDGILRTDSESSIRQNLKLNNEAGINSQPDAELFENLILMGYNISPNQKLLFKRGEGLGTPTKPHHTPSPEAQQTSCRKHINDDLVASGAQTW
nr:hypothetical protein [Tanacetum cinerariifolium]